MMYLISSRNNFTDGKRFSEEDHLRHVGGPNQQLMVSKETFISDIESQTVLLIVHGFNNPFSYVVREYLRIKVQWERLLGSEYNYILGYTWPAGNSELDYFHARKNTDEAGRRLSKWLEFLTNANCNIDVMGHSMAAMVGFKALKEKTSIKIRNVFSFGAAISRDILFKENIVPQILEKVQQFYVFHNRNDGILKYGFRMIERKEALGYAGFSDKEELLKSFDKVNLIDCSDVIFNHTDYTRSLLVPKFLSDVLKGKVTNQFADLTSRARHKPRNLYSVCANVS